ncbi:hypothetical protein D3C76_1688130 [compost metagenome]
MVLAYHSAHCGLLDAANFTFERRQFQGQVEACAFVIGQCIAHLGGYRFAQQCLVLLPRIQFPAALGESVGIARQ